MLHYQKNNSQLSRNLFQAVEGATLDLKPALELTREQKERLQTTAAVALSLIAVAGIITIAAVAPNVFQAFNQVYKLSKKRKLTFREKQNRVAHTFYYLKRRGLIQIGSGKHGLVAKLTGKGKKRMEKLHFETLRVPKQNKWDGKWWLTAADIPTKHYRWAADSLRKKIKQMGFYPLQRTMWFYPYNPAAEIEFLAKHYGIGQFVTVMEVSRMDKDDEGKLKKYFGI